MSSMVCKQQMLISAWASIHSDQHLCYSLIGSIISFATSEITISLGTKVFSVAQQAGLGMNVSETQNIENIGQCLLISSLPGKALRTLVDIARLAERFNMRSQSRAW